MEKEKIKSAAEALLFINEKPIISGELAQILEVDKKDIEDMISDLILEYSDRGSGLCIVKVAGGYQMCSSPENEVWVKKMLQERNKQKLSLASLETLAIIAYKQPITRVEIETIRGVNVDGVMKKLTDADIVKISGRKDVVGRPFLYATTAKFLEYFGLNSLKDLPRLEDFVTLAEQNKGPENIKHQTLTTSDVEQDSDINKEKAGISNTNEEEVGQ
ncbi:MAG: SMC-Scp complex subunit ScpB [Candidatus Omnitrophota bacterium]